MVEPLPFLPTLCLLIPSSARAAPNSISGSGGGGGGGGGAIVLADLGNSSFTPYMAKGLYSFTATVCGGLTILVLCSSPVARYLKASAE